MTNAGSQPVPTRETQLHEIEARETFDQVAALYDQMRPTYPDQLFADVIAFAGLDTGSDADFNAGAHLLEIGCGTGHATIGFAQRGFAIDAIELGEQMAAIAREKLADFPSVRVTVADFDLWLPDSSGNSDSGYDLVYSASAWHWLNPATRQSRAASVLKNSGLRTAGAIALWRNFHVRGESGDPFYPEAQKIYAGIAPQLAAKATRLPAPSEAPMEIARELESGGIFRDVETRDYLWPLTYTAEEYVQMLDTHSDHRLLAPEARKRLFTALVRLIEAEFAGTVTKHHLTRLHLARKSP